MRLSSIYEPIDFMRGYGNTISVNYISMKIIWRPSKISSDYPLRDYVIAFKREKQQYILYISELSFNIFVSCRLLSADTHPFHSCDSLFWAEIFPTSPDPYYDIIPTENIFLKGQCLEIFAQKTLPGPRIWEGTNSFANFFVFAKIFAKNVCPRSCWLRWRTVNYLTFEKL